MLALWLAPLCAHPAERRAIEYPSCGTSASELSGGQAARTQLPAGTLLRALQDPPIVYAGYQGAIRYELAVLGDFTSIDFQIESFTELRRFSAEREERYVNPQGDVISIFAVEGTLEQWLVLPWSWDLDLTSPYVFSELLYLGPPAQQQPIFLPIALLPKTLPHSKVVRVDSRLQIASNLINVAVPDLHRQQLDQLPNLGFEPNQVIDLLEQKLGAFAYDEFGFGLWQHELTNPGAFHSFNLASPHPPYSLYTSSSFFTRELWKHEVNHNWNFRYDLPRLVGWEAPFDGFHSRGTVAKEAGMLCCSAYPIRKLNSKWRTTWIRDPHPFHPLELFAMGLIDEREVPDMFVFKRQDLRDYYPNEALSGPTRRLSVDQVIAEYGRPAPAAKNDWRVAPVLVSEKLLPKRLISDINFLMRRMEDPEGKVPASFDQATGYLMDLKTTVVRAGHPGLKPPPDVTFPPIEREEIPGITLERALPGCLKPGQTLRLEGRTTTGASPGIALVPSNPDYPTLEAPASQSHQFRVALAPDKEDVYQVRIDGVWPRREPLPVLVGPIYVTPDCF
ncbi:MAG TPA: hypothetical protein VGB99_12840 [Acidobacteriota bacterium]